MSDRPRIAQVITRFIAGGAMLVCLEAAKGLAKRGWDVEIWTGPPLGAEGDLLFDAWRENVKTVLISDMRRDILPSRDYRSYLQIRQEIRRFRPDVVQTHSSKAGVLGRYAASCERVPVVVHTCHGLAFGNGRFLYDKIIPHVERAAALRCDKILCVAKNLVTRLKDHKVAGDEKVVHFPWGLDFSGFERGNRSMARNKMGIGREVRLVVLPARLAHDKGHGDALRAMKMQGMEDVSLLLLGDGPLRGVIESEAGQLGLSQRVIFAGKVTRRDMPHYLAASDVLLLPSYREGLPIVFAEGFMAGIPAVAYDTDGVSELVIGGQTGVLVKKGDIAGLASGILALLADNKMASEFAKRGRDMILAGYTSEVMCNGLDAMFRALLQGKREISARARGNQGTIG